ncbi:hypothetical protein [Inquilinus sp.]|uniref:hypothetical protein n=1 Tax=Inquilinus sp. TaxID=1932117 RepID=UPI0031E4449B
MSSLRPQANDNRCPEDRCKRQMDEVKRRFVAKIACAVGEQPPSHPDASPEPNRSPQAPTFGAGRS